MANHIRNFDKMVTICSENPKIQQFKVYLDFICHHSPKFKNWFDSCADLRTKVIMPDTTARSVRLLIYWLYTGEIGDLGEQKRETTKYRSRRQRELVRLCVLASELDIGPLTRLVLDEIWENMTERELVDFETVEYAYKNTKPGDPLRKLLAHQFAFTRHTRIYEVHGAKLPRELLVDVIVLLTGARQEVDWELWRPFQEE